MPDSTSLILASARWLTYVAALLVIGGAGARIVVSRAAASAAIPPIQAILFTRIERTARLGAWLWCVSVAATLGAQLIAWFGADGMLERENVSVMITGTVWGQNWQWTAVGSGFVLLLFVAARVAPALGALVIFASALTVASLAPLVGHGGSHGTTTWMLHGAHMLGAGVWIGTVAVLLRSSFALWSPTATGSHAEALRALLLAVTPVALTGAGLAAATGLILGFEHVQPLSAAVETAFGITLLVKIFVVLDLVALGYLNWKVFGPRVLEPDQRMKLRSVVIAEVALGLVLVLAITSWLSGLPIPSVG